MGTDEILVLDKAGALDRIGGDEELFVELVGIFVEDVPIQLASLKQAFAESDQALVERQAHTIKSASGNIGAEAVREVCWNMELASREGSLDKASALLSKLESELERLHNELVEQGIE